MGCMHMQISPPKPLQTKCFWIERGWQGISLSPRVPATPSYTSARVETVRITDCMALAISLEF